MKYEIGNDDDESIGTGVQLAFNHLEMSVGGEGEKMACARAAGLIIGATGFIMSRWGREAATQMIKDMARTVKEMHVEDASFLDQADTSKVN